MEYIMQVLCCVLLGVFIVLNLGFFVRLVIDIIDDRKDAKRKDASEQREIEYHNKRMSDFR